MALNRADIFATLQTDILRLQGFNAANNSNIDFGLGALKDCFPNGAFPLGAVHEFLSDNVESLASTNGFLSGLLSSLMGNNGTSVWISSNRTLFPPSLINFGIKPDHFIFVDLKNEKDVVWAVDEALKCGALSAVVAEMRELNFTTSRRFQLAVEKSHATGFIVRNNYRSQNTTACVSRWKIKPVPSAIFEDLPGIGFPKWQVELVRMRNGRSGVWDFEWMNGKFKVTTTYKKIKDNNEDLAYRQINQKAG